MSLTTLDYKPPAEYPFGSYELALEIQVRESCNRVQKSVTFSQDPEKIEELADKNLENKDYIDALWMYENLLALYTRQSPDPNERLSRATFKCATTLLKGS